MQKQIPKKRKTKKQTKEVCSKEEEHNYSLFNLWAIYCKLVAKRKLGNGGERDHDMIAADDKAQNQQ